MTFEFGAIETPLVPFDGECAPSMAIYLKLENLQPVVHSFKIRGVSNFLAAHRERVLSARGVFTASAGNCAQAVAHVCAQLGVASVTCVVPDSAPAAKLDAIRRLGASIVQVSFDEWWHVLQTHAFAPLPDHVFVHPVCGDLLQQGHGSIADEIVRALPDVDSIVVPFGGGGLACGIAAAVQRLGARCRVFACEVETAAPFAAALRHGAPVRVDYTASFVDGIGSGCVLAEMWPLAQRLLAGSIVVSLAQVAAALRQLVERNRVVVEGAAAAALAAALSGDARLGTRVVAVLSGGCIDTAKLVTLLSVQ